MKINNPTQEWFCYDSYAASLRTKMEEEVLRYARKTLLYHIIHEGDFSQVIRELEMRQDALSKVNPRWKRVKFSFEDNGIVDGHCWLRIGDSNLSLRKVLGSF